MTDTAGLQFDGKVAIVSGGASGMGAEVARLLVQGGGKVVLADINDAAGKALARELGEAARFVRTDVTCIEDTKAVAAAAQAAFGHINILFNNAGMGSLIDISSVDAVEWRRVIDVNMNSAFYMTQAVLPFLRAAGGGSIVNTCSVSGLAGDYGMSAYNAAKSGLINLTRAFALDLAKSNIRVNAICPGIIADTTMASPLKDGPGGLATWDARIPMRRTGRAIEVARVMAFVASDLASYMTGSVTVIDGGLTCHTGMPTPEDFSSAAAR